MKHKISLQTTLAVLLTLTQLVVAQDSTGRPDVRGSRTFVGSAVCITCHANQANSWKHSLHARFMRSWATELQNPVVDWKAAPAVPFDASQIAFVMGNMHKLVFLRKADQGHEFFPQQFDIQTKTWERFDPGLWVPLDANANLETTKPWERYCAGCHVSGYEPQAGKFTEVNITCENCHGPGSAHAQSEERNDIINPAALQGERANHVCARCHSRGHDLKTGLPYPVGFVAGDNLTNTFLLDRPTPGTNTPGFWGDGVARMHHSQYNEFLQSKHASQNVKCFECHQVHRYRESPPSGDTRLMANTERFLLKKRARFVCVTCHDNRNVNYGTETANGKIVDTHTHHPPVIARNAATPAAKSTDNKSAKGMLTPMTCQDCHMTKRSSATGGYDTASHIFHTPAPGSTRLYGVPNACNNCHANESVAWAEKQIADWRKKRQLGTSR